MFKVVDNEFNRANYPSIIGNIYPKPPAYVNVVPCSNCHYTDGTTHVVQAWMSGRGFVDCKLASSEDEAKQLEQALKADSNAWMPDDTERRTRIVFAQ